MCSVRGSEGNIGHVVFLDLNADGMFWKPARAAWACPLIQSDKALLRLLSSWSVNKRGSPSSKPISTLIRLLLGCARKCTNPTVLSIKEYDVGPIKTHSIGTDGTTGYL